jgi:hypothetical protein
MLWLGALWHLLGVLTDVGPVGLVAGAGALAGVVLTAMLAARALRRRMAVRPGSRITGQVLRERASRTGVPRHRDPDAAGRARPRAPSADSAAA